MNRWQEIINYLNMTAEWVQVILTFGGLVLAFGYLGQHARKVRVEHSYSLVHGCMVKISRYVGKYHLFYKKVFASQFRVFLKEISAIEAVNEIYEKNYNLKEEMIEIDLLNFEIDAEIKLIGHKRITSLWNDLLTKNDSIAHLLENLYKIKGDQEKCEDFINDLPHGLLNRDHQLSSLFLTSYLTLMSSLLIFYQSQEDELSYTRLFHKWKQSKKRP